MACDTWLTRLARTRGVQRRKQKRGWGREPRAASRRESRARERDARRGPSPWYDVWHAPAPRDALRPA
eukprot:scaffold18990_cov69-Phaeocystis_antarctica.AAC.5